MIFKTVVVIGAGTMGAGIAQWFLQQKINVELVDSNYELALLSSEGIKKNLDSLTAKGKLTAEESNHFKTALKVVKLQEISPNCELVIEAIIENKEIKRKLFTDLEKIVSKETIIASNTSSFPITELSSSLSLDRRSNFLGLHFFNPATIMKLVEVISGNLTDKKLAQSIAHWFNQRGKVACECNDAPGFIVNRVARNFYGESLRACTNYNLDTIKEIDTTLKAVGGFKMGPFELMDLIGIDVNLSVTESVYHAFFEEPRFKPHRLQKEMVDSQRLGRKTKIGFYHYDS
ncbi:MAG: 3-hydroxybutyryl-CoA dehydrogenase [Bacteriovoracaceae bacterium]|nr:3-hydroxybutyryl-CoA dehydrogenase [Bacteriovoracaceae bacterium]